MKTALSEKARQARNEYQRNYRRRNPDKIRQYIANYWERKAEKQAAGREMATAGQIILTSIVCGTELTEKRQGAKFCSNQDLIRI